ncbi:hypothetical protein QQ045_006999 [Rhodiola kirilowii]
MSGEGNKVVAPCVPKFDGDYEHWSLIMENLLCSKEYWEVMEVEYNENNQDRPMSHVLVKKLEEFKLKDLKAKNYLFQVIDKSALKTITQKSIVKSWDTINMSAQLRSKSKIYRNERREGEDSMEQGIEFGHLSNKSLLTMQTKQLVKGIQMLGGDP